MKVIVRRNATTKTGYELATIDDNGIETTQPITRQHVERGQLLLDLPKNAFDRGYLSVKKFNDEAVDGCLELTPHVARAATVGTGTSTGSKLNELRRYLKPAEQEQLDELIKRANLRREIEQAKQAYEIAAAKLAELQNTEAE